MNKDYKQSLNPIIKARLSVLLEALNNLYSNGFNGMVLEKDLISLYSTAIRTFYQSLESSITSTTLDIIPGTPPDPDMFNSILVAVNQDLLCLYKEIAIIDKLISANFNSIAIGKDQITQTSRRISNKLGDYLLYADPKLGAGFFFSDSFNSLDKIDPDSSLIEEERCYQDIEEGTILLPLDGEPSYPEIKSIVINDTSNGILGNNYQLGTYGHDAIEAITDNKPNTWVEYEKVVSKELSTPLILDLTLTLGESSIINFININPLFFGTPSPLEVKVIETSSDGKDFVSIKDELPVRDFIPEEESNVFSLSATTVNNTGQGNYSFLPRRAKYIHIVLHQSTPYGIETSNGSMLRYAIGIRDLSIVSRKFNTSGSIVSTPFSTTEEIRKVSLWASENPVEASSLSDISHFISSDDGGSWLQIQPQGRSSNLVPEILNFNTISEDSVSTSEGVQSLRHKIVMTRNSESFNGEYTIRTEELEKLDVVGIPNPASPEIALTEEPVPKSLVTIMPYLGSFSCPRDRYGSNVLDESTPMSLDFVEFSIDAPGATSGVDPGGNPQQEGTLRFPLPYRNIPNLSEKIRVFVNGAQIEYRPKDDYFFDNPSEFTPNPVNIKDYSKVYYLNKNGTELQFGYKQKTGSGAGYQRGFIPSAGAKIQVCLDGDNPKVELTDQGFELKLLMPTDGDKEAISIVALKTLENQSATQYEIEIPVGERIFQAPILKDLSIGESLSSEEDGFKIPLFLEGTDNFVLKEYDLDGTLITGSNRQFTTKEEYVNGRYEVQSFFGDDLVHNYTFDPETGTVYLGTEARSGRRTVLVCNKIEAEKILPDNWSFGKNTFGAIDPQTIVLNPSAVFSFRQSTSFLLGSSSVRSLQLIMGNTKSHSWFNKRLVKGTVKPAQSLFSPNVSLVEVDYINGDSEFSNITLIEDEPVSLTYVSALTSSLNLYSFSLSKADSVKLLSGVPTFSIVRSTNSATIYDNRFEVDGQVSSTGAISGAGQWVVSTNSTTGIVTITIAATSGILSESYAVSYKVKNTDSGLDAEGLYSVDYENGVLHLSNPAVASGSVEYEVSMYSCFYNIGKIISDKEIDEIDETGKKIVFNPSFAMKFLKLSTADKARPQILKILYTYNKKVSESLADLEPYFSPICKQIGIRAVTSNLLEEL